jgi:hypothetical protein
LLVQWIVIQREHRGFPNGSRGDETGRPIIGERLDAA